MERIEFGVVTNQAREIFGRIFRPATPLRGVNLIYKGEGEVNLAKTAYGLFVDASSSCSASVAGQASRIALLCKKADLQPGDLKRILMADQKLMDALVVVANNIHVSKSTGPKVDVDLSGIMDVVRADFDLAQELMVLESGFLEEASTTLYYGYIKSPPRKETAFRDYLKHRVAEARVYLATKK